MEEKQRSVISNSLNYGLLVGAAMIVFSLIMYIADLYMNKAVNWIGYIFLVAGMIWGTLEYRKKYANGFLSYGKAFSSCFWIGLFGGIISTIYFFIFIKFIHPGFINEIIDQMRANMIASNPEMSEDQMEQAISMSSKFMSPVFMTLWGFAAYAAMSAVLGLIIAIFLKKEDPSLNSIT